MKTYNMNVGKKNDLSRQFPNLYSTKTRSIKSIKNNQPFFHKVDIEAEASYS